MEHIGHLDGQAGSWISGEGSCVIKEGKVCLLLPLNAVFPRKVNLIMLMREFDEAFFSRRQCFPKDLIYL